MSYFLATEGFEFLVTSRLGLEARKASHICIAEVRLLVLNSGINSLEIFGGHMSFFGATGTPVWDFW